MIGAHQPTETEMRAHSRHRAFHQGIAERAAALKVAPASGCCPHCGRDKSTPPVPPPSPDSAMRFMQPNARIQYLVCRAFDVTVADLVSQRRDKIIIMPRQVAYYLGKELTSHSWEEIGRRCGGRDHSSVFHGHQKIKRMLLTDPKLAETIAAIRAELEAML